MEAGVNQVQLHWSKLYFEDQIDPFKGLNPSLSVTDGPPSALNRMELDLGTGLLIYRDNGYVGLSLKHLNRFNQTFFNTSILETGRPMTFSLQSGFDFPVSGRGIGKGPVYLSPMLLYLSNNQSKIIQMGSSYHLGQLIIGVWARFGGIQPIESIVGFGFKKGIYKILYTAEIPIDGKGLKRTLGSHEITLSLMFSEAQNYISKKSAQKTLNCFRFNN
jgi:type IX secretion system PorP/SprF family membrane protein